MKSRKQKVRPQTLMEEVHNIGKGAFVVMSIFYLWFMAFNAVKFLYGLVP